MSGNSKSSKSSTKESELDNISDWSNVGSINNLKIDLDEKISYMTHVRIVKLENEVFSCLDNCINNNFNYESIRSHLASQTKNKNLVENSNTKDLISIVFGTIMRHGSKKINDKQF